MESHPNKKVDSIAIIGAGPGGLAAAKYLVAEKAFSKIEVFEQRATVGGVWNATPGLVAADDRFIIPRTKPTADLNKPVWESAPERGSFQFISPVYDDLHTNIPHTLMKYSDLDFPEGCSVFPRHEIVLEYLERYAEEVRHLIRFGTQVLDVSPVERNGSRIWSVITKDIETGTETMENFDAVVVANGHYDDAFVPNIAGLKEWNEAFPGSVTHSKFYRGPDAYTNKKVVIVGYLASGVDISAQISSVSQHPLLISEKTVTEHSQDQSNDETVTEHLPQIEEFILEARALRFINGRIEKNVDAVVFCTGYMYSYPFLRNLSPSPVTDGTRTRNLYQQVFYYPIPTLSFISLPQRIIPFQISEAQSAIIARVLSGRLSLPPLAEMQAWEASFVVQRGDGKTYHILGYPLDAIYINSLHDWAVQAPRHTGLANEGTGKLPPYWGEEEQWIRERTPLIKIASRNLDSARHTVKSVKELGFDFQQWKRDMAGD